MMYDNWINENVPDRCMGKCKEYVDFMYDYFLISDSALKKKRGWYHCPIWGKREHWWLVDSDGSIIDPTAKQFPSKGIGLYEDLIEGSKEPSGRCMNCGEYCYDGRNACSTECLVLIEEYYGI